MTMKIRLRMKVRMGGMREEVGIRGMMLIMM